MSQQIAVQLSDDIVEFIDGLVDGGQAASRAVVVARALDSERRRVVAARDAAVLPRVDADQDSSGAGFAVHTRLDDLD